MKTFTQDELAIIQDKHRRWLLDSAQGERAVLTDSYFCRLDLTGYDFTRAILNRSIFSDATLDSARFNGALLRDTTFTRAHLLDTQFSLAHLENAQFDGAVIQYASFTRATLTDASFQGASVRDTSFRLANLTGANFSGVDFSTLTMDDALMTGVQLPDGTRWDEYLTDVVPALLQVTGLKLEQVATEETWTCHNWENCPMRVVFGAKNTSEVPALYRAQAALFVTLFDARLIPQPR